MPLHTFFGLRLLDMLGAFSKIYDFVESHCLDDCVVGSLNLEGFFFEGPKQQNSKFSTK